MILFLILLLIGIFAGMLAGMLGVGGGLIFTPVLFFLFTGSGVEQPVLWTIASSLFCTFIASTSSVYRQFRMDNIFLKQSLMVGVLGIAGTFVGRQIITSPVYSEFEFTMLFSLLLIYTAFKFWRGKGNPATPETTGEAPITIQNAILIGGLGGFIATLAGVGGGVVMIPLMTMLFLVPFTKAVSISSFAIVLISFSACSQLAIMTPQAQGITNISVGFVDFGTVLPLVIGSIFGANVGVWLNSKVQRRTFEVVFAILNLLVAGRMLYGVL